MMSKITKIDLHKINQQSIEYFYPGYNLFFIHGWFCSYLSAPSDSEEDLVIPSYLVLNEDKIIDEKKFAKFVDDLMVIYSEISDNIYEKNKQIKPLVNLNNPNDFNVFSLSSVEKENLLTWLYGYLCGYLVIGSDITEYCEDEKLLDDKFFPALLTVCSIFLLLDKEHPALFMDEVLEDFLDVKADILDMWEVDEGQTLQEQLADVVLADVMPDFVNALNSIFYIIRVADEARFASDQQSPLLKKLVIH